MAFKWADRIRETSATTGTGPLTLAGATSGYFTFASAFTDTVDTFNYAIVNGTEFETGIGHIEGSTLVRDTVQFSSNSNAAVNFSAGTKECFVTVNAAHIADLRDDVDALETAPPDHATSHKHGGGDEVATATAAANVIPKTGAGGKLDIGFIPTGSSSTTVAIGNDSRLSDSRTPTAHSASHKHGGADEVATATPTANAIPKAGADGTLDPGWVSGGNNPLMVQIFS
jgi:hypothetical protein